VSPEAGGEDRAGVLLPDVEGRADMARTLPEGDPRYVTDFLPRMDGAGCPLGAGRLGFTYDGLSPRLCRELRTPELAGLLWATRRRFDPSSSPSAGKSLISQR
jgi:hypothetical protein